MLSLDLRHRLRSQRKITTVPNPNPLSRFNPDELHHRVVALGEEWATLNAAADLLEESKKTVLAELQKQAQGGGVAERERTALADPIYGDHLDAMVDARRKANIARIHYDAAKAWIEMARSMESTRRAEMQMR